MTTAASWQKSPDDRCVHDMTAADCDLCRPRPAPRQARVHENIFVRIEPARLFHLPDCEEVTWDPNEAENPGERVTLTTTQVQTMLADGTLERGGYCCGAHVRVTD
jgi:hypothetical protein